MPTYTGGIQVDDAQRGTGGQLKSWIHGGAG
jgi:hypothetical protein